VDPSNPKGFNPTGANPTGLNPSYGMSLAEAARSGMGYYRGGWAPILKTTQITDTNPQWVGWTNSPPSPAVPSMNTTVDNYSMDYGMATANSVNRAGTA